MNVDPNTPTINGVPFADTYGLDISATSRLIYDGMIFLTEFNLGGKSYGGDVIARDLEHAKRVADERGLGEIVVGQLEATILATKGD